MVRYRMNRKEDNVSNCFAVISLEGEIVTCVKREDAS